jgi:uncharacterized protein YlxW (UPF0749 family)
MKDVIDSVDTADFTAAPPQKKSRAAVVLFMVILLLIGVIAALTWFYRNQYNELEQLNMQLEAQRDTLNEQLYRLLDSYDSVQYVNGAMQTELEREKKKINMLI